MKVKRVMKFGEAIELAKLGKAVARSDWSGKGMWITMSPGCLALPGDSIWAPANRAYARHIGGYIAVLPSMTMRTTTGDILMGWLASQTDMLSEDWVEVEPK